MKELKIIEAENGYILESVCYETDIRLVKEYKVVEDVHGELDLIRLLENVAEYFGYGYDKFGKENINITFDKPGHKVE